MLSLVGNGVKYKLQPFFAAANLQVAINNKRIYVVKETNWIQPSFVSPSLPPLYSSAKCCVPTGAEYIELTSSTLSLCTLSEQQIHRLRPVCPLRGHPLAAAYRRQRPHPRHGRRGRPHPLGSHAIQPRAAGKKKNERSRFCCQISFHLVPIIFIKFQEECCFAAERFLFVILIFFTCLM